MGGAGPGRPHFSRSLSQKTPRGWVVKTVQHLSCIQRATRRTLVVSDRSSRVWNLGPTGAGCFSLESMGGTSAAASWPFPPAGSSRPPGGAAPHLSCPGETAYSSWPWWVARWPDRHTSTAAVGCALASSLGSFPGPVGRESQSACRLAVVSLAVPVLHSADLQPRSPVMPHR